MQDTRTNKLVPGEFSEAMRERFERDAEGLEAALRSEFGATGKVRKADQGPLFVEGEIVELKGYGYRVTGIKKNRLFLKPHGPLNPPEKT